VGGRLQHFASVWKQNLQLSKWHIRALEEGVPIEWCQDYKPGTNKPFDSALRYRVDSKERQSCSKTLQHYLDIGAVEVLPPDTQGGLWHTFFPVPKKGTDKVRGCIDLRKVNQHIVYRHFKMEGLHTVSQLAKRGDYGVTVDMRDFYMHWLIRKRDRPLMRFMWEGVKYQCLAMPFGLAPAPRLATKLFLPVLRKLRSMGLRVTGYIDDCLLLSRSYRGALQQAQLMVDLIHKLGFDIHPEKSQLVPSQSRVFLGTQVNTRLMQFRVPREKLRSIRREISALLHQNESGGLTTRLLACMLGKLNALRGAVVSAQLHLWPLHHLLRQSLAASSWEGKVVLDDPSIEELLWWQQQMHQWSGQTIIPKRSQMVLTTDASHLGWGGWWRKFGQKGRFLDEARGFWLAREANMSSNGRELKAVLLSVKAAISHLAGHIVLVETDNKVTMAYINHMGGRSRFLHSMARELWLLCHQHSILLQAVHRPGKVNLRADRLSRWTVDHTDVRLPLPAFQRVEQLWGPHTVDLFASRHNHLLPRYVSWKPDPEAIAVDAFMFQLRGENPYCFPPPACIPRLLQEVLHQQATVTLIAPGWQAPWLPDLQRLLLAPPLPLRELPELPVQDQASRFLHWNLHCFRISGSHSRLAHTRRAMQTQL
jgi:hypothetical protein